MFGRSWDTYRLGAERGRGRNYDTTAAQHVARFDGGGETVGFGAGVPRTVGRGAPCLSVSRLQELLLYARAFVANNMSTKSNPRGGLHAVA